MKLAAAIIAVFFLGSILANPVSKEEFENFKALYGKIYSDAAEESRRFSIFSENLRFISHHNQKYLRGASTYSMAMNQFGDLTSEEFSSRMNGYLPTAGGDSELYTYPEVEDLPDSVDWRDAGAVTEVKDQGSCGSCWSFSATGSLEGQHFLKKGELVSLSEQNLMDCSKGMCLNGECNGGCIVGGLMDIGFMYVAQNGGLDTEESYPYTAKLGQCDFNPDTVGATDTGYIDLPSGDEDALKSAVANVGPISVAMDASKASFTFYKSGVYCDITCNSTELDHGVLAVGYGTNASEGDFWIVKNSWSTSWGDDGYMKICRNKNNRCGLATDASYPIVA